MINPDYDPDVNRKKCFSIVSNYGLMVAQQVVNILSKEEDYERAAMLQGEILWWCERFNLDKPEINFDMEDYRAEFWKLGHSGDIAEEAYSTYLTFAYQDIKKILS